MTEKFPRGRTAIVSTATYGMGEAPGLQSIDLLAHASIAALAQVGLTLADVDGAFTGMPFDLISGLTIGRASCRECVCQYVWISVVAVSLSNTIVPHRATTHYRVSTLDTLKSLCIHTLLLFS